MSDRRTAILTQLDHNAKLYLYATLPFAELLDPEACVMLAALLALIERGDLTEVERIELPPVPERREPVPNDFRVPGVGDWLTKSPELKAGLWTHQAKALVHAATGKNIVVATGTASGKSLIFQATAFWRLNRDPDSTTLVLYPLKALVADQLESWRRIAPLCGFSPDVVGRIDGDVDQDERRQILESAKIVVATPDVIHAWLMSKLAQPAHKRFQSRLRLVVIDEAHVLESVFGSNFAFLFRRLLSAARLTQRSPDPHDLQVVAASATISNADSHLAALTGLEFVSIGEQDDGSPRHRRQIVHIASASGDEAKTV
jgi:DEAD/DEAH box helicase domain-containing protein